MIRPSTHHVYTELSSSFDIAELRARLCAHIAVQQTRCFVQGSPDLATRPQSKLPTLVSGRPSLTWARLRDGLLEVRRGFGHGLWPSFSIHLRRQGRHRRVYLDPTQRNKEGTQPPPPSPTSYPFLANMLPLGGWLKLQHLFFRHPCQQIPLTAGEKRAQEITNPPSPRRTQGPRYRRGTKSPYSSARTGPES